MTSDLIIVQDGVVLRDAIIPLDDNPGLYQYYEGTTYMYQFHNDAVNRDDAICLLHVGRYTPLAGYCLRIYMKSG